MTTPSLRSFHADRARVEIYPSKLAASIAAAAMASSILNVKATASERRGFRIVVGTGNSQEDLVKELVQNSSTDWSRIEVFHMDEYVGMPATHPASFRRWLSVHFDGLVSPKQIHYLTADAPDLGEECHRYTDLLCSDPIDVCFLGFGENGHIAFNDPHTADFNDPRVVKRVTLDEKCRFQQVREGHFSDIRDVPHEALTITCPFLMRSKYLVCCVPEHRKAETVRSALMGPVSPACPASLVRTHPGAFIFLDTDSASMISPQPAL